jgi:hypothetical protein
LLDLLTGLRLAFRQIPFPSAMDEDHVRLIGSRADQDAAARLYLLELAVWVEVADRLRRHQLRLLGVGGDCEHSPGRPCGMVGPM